MRTTSKLQSGTSIFTTMSKMANDHNAINLSQGFPNFEVDPVLTDIVARAAKGNLHQYMPSIGYLPLLENIQKLVLKAYGRTAGIDEIVVTAGATQGIFTAIQAVVHVGDEVIILDPAYDCYDAPVILSGAKPVHISLADDFSPNWQAIIEAFSRNTRMIIINNPHNPSGRIWDENDFIQLENLLENYPDVIVLSDEVYEFITFENRHISVNTRSQVVDRSIIVSSFGKSFHITGWKIGYLIAPKNLMAEIRKVHQFLVFSVNSIAQAAIAEYLNVADVFGLAQFYQEKRDYFRHSLADSRFELLPCEGTYFQLATYAKISDSDDLNFTKELVTTHGVSAIPLSPFYQNGKDSRLVRFCFAKDNATIDAAARKLKNV
ncbi:MAG: aminotransferase class I/II-fold pyridoxal phosphate-dependent enzyme [Flavobacterium sp.]|nr:MAG: aminotransferase class I/II-fold pyridoxal phosphate-dependent enzyme [Flavobacterium sp.]